MHAHGSQTGKPDALAYLLKAGRIAVVGDEALDEIEHSFLLGSHSSSLPLMESRNPRSRKRAAKSPSQLSGVANATPTAKRMYAIQEVAVIHWPSSAENLSPRPAHQHSL